MPVNVTNFREGVKTGSLVPSCSTCTACSACLHLFHDAARLITATQPAINRQLQLCNVTYSRCMHSSAHNSILIMSQRPLESALADQSTAISSKPSWGFLRIARDLQMTVPCSSVTPSPAKQIRPQSSGPWAAAHLAGWAGACSPASCASGTLRTRHRPPGPRRAPACMQTPNSWLLSLTQQE